MKKIRFIYIYCIGVTLLLFGIFYHVFYGTPPQYFANNMSPEEKAISRLHDLISMWCIFGGVVLMGVSIVGGVIKALSKRLASPLHKKLIAISFLILGGLSGACLVMGVPHPASIAHAVAHVFVSVTLLLVGLGLLLQIAVSKIRDNKAAPMSPLAAE